MKKLTTDQQKPTDIVHELDQYVIGQEDAKKAVAIALRNRWRRLNVADEQMRQEISPKNILMVGPTGVGKTEIARRLAGFSTSPFVKVEATKFTEVGYVGRDVDSIIRDLLDCALKIVRQRCLEQVKEKAIEEAQKQVLEALYAAEDKELSETEKKDIQRRFHDDQLNDEMIEINLSSPQMGIEIMSPAGMEDISTQLQDLVQSMQQDKNQKHKKSVTQALEHLTDDITSQLIYEQDIKKQAIELTEQQGIVFIDEIDKVVRSNQYHGEVSREGVQRDLLPLLDGTTVNTKYGMVQTDHILFIASGAFMNSQPKDMISELQGRLPTKVRLKSLTREDFVRILIEPKSSLIKQYTALLATENIHIKFSKDGIQAIADNTAAMNEGDDDIGARRLHAVMESLLEKISFHVNEHANKTALINKSYVNKALKTQVVERNDEHWIL